MDGPEAIFIRGIHVHFAFVKEHLDNILLALFTGDVKGTKLQSGKDGRSRDCRTIRDQNGQSNRVVIAPNCRDFGFKISMASNVRLLHIFGGPFNKDFIVRIRIWEHQSHLIIILLDNTESGNSR